MYGSRKVIIFSSSGCVSVTIQTPIHDHAALSYGDVYYLNIESYKCQKWSYNVIYGTLIMQYTLY